MGLTCSWLSWPLRLLTRRLMSRQFVLKVLLLSRRHFLIPFLKWINLLLFCALSLFVISLKADREAILQVRAPGRSQSHPSTIIILPLRTLCGFRHYKSCIVYKYIPTRGFYLLFYLGWWVTSERRIPGCFLLQSRALGKKTTKKQRAETAR